MANDTGREAAKTGNRAGGAVAVAEPSDAGFGGGGNFVAGVAGA
ncbi:hypothetical protein [Paenarthrobacter sp. Z7-10]|nr:hypothetical protein [Paenarthrobacter sp. Z7-10]